MDVVRRYDIDGVHFDDYFYPYPETVSPKSKVEMEFPDDANWARYQKSGGKMSRNDWRRDNVNLIRPRRLRRHQAGEAVGQIRHRALWHLAAESSAGHHRLRFLQQALLRFAEMAGQGWVDYVTPQLYWPVDQKAQSFPVLLNWWAEQNSRHRLLCPGMKVEGWKGVNDEARELTNEVYCHPAPKRRLAAMSSGTANRS